MKTKKAARIRGVGVDITLRPRITRLLRFSDRVVSRILRPPELLRFKQAKDKADTLARYFSAKEAAFKSLGFRTFGPVGFRWIEIRFHSPEKGTATLHDRLKRAARNRIPQILVQVIRVGRHYVAQAVSFH